jgi:hypothetical protein
MFAFVALPVKKVRNGDHPKKHPMRVFVPLPTTQMMNLKVAKDQFATFIGSGEALRPSVAQAGLRSRNFFCCRCCSRTPEPPPLSSMNSTPANSNAV